MAKQVQFRRGTTAQLSSVTGVEGELFVDTTKDTITVHDGYQAGGRPLLREDLSNLANNAINPLTKLSVSGGSAGQELRVNSAGNAFEYITPYNFSASQLGNWNDTVSVSGSSSTVWHDIRTYSAAAGIYIAHLSYTTSPTDGEYPNNDPDSWGARIYAGSEIAFTSAGIESNPQGHKLAGSLMGVFTLSSTTTVQFQISTRDSRLGGDTDPGGTTGRMCTTIARLG